MSPFLTTAIGAIILIAALAGLWMQGMARIHRRQMAELRRLGEIARRHGIGD